jgi:NhaA family Na+:H+ antiporter
MIVRALKWSWLVFDSVFVLPLGCLVALAWANLEPTSYYTTSNALEFAVNRVGLALFFGVMTKHVVEETLSGGALHSWRRAALPILAGFGAVVVPIGIYLGFLSFVGEPMLTAAWPTSTAVDVAICFVAGRILFGRHAAVPFLVLLSFAADAIGLTVLALTRPNPIIAAPAALTSVFVGVTVALWLRRAGARSFWPYLLVPGVLCWGGLYLAGVQPAMALVFVVPFMPHARRDPGLLADPSPTARDTLSKFERFWTPPVQVILFLFGLVNAGVPLHGLEAGMWALPLALVVGRPIGVILATELGVLVGFHRTTNIGLKELVVIGFVAAAGFSMALFFASGVLSTGPLLQQLRVGALISLVGPVLGWMAARAFGVGCYARDTADVVHPQRRGQS